MLRRHGITTPEIDHFWDHIFGGDLDPDDNGFNDPFGDSDTAPPLHEDTSSDSTPSITEEPHQWEAAPFPILTHNPATLNIHNLFNSDADFIGEPALPFSPLPPSLPRTLSPYTPPPIYQNMSDQGEEPQMNSAELLQLLTNQAELITNLQTQLTLLQANQATAAAAAAAPPIVQAPVVNIPEGTVFNFTQPAGTGNGGASKVDVAKLPVFSGRMAEVTNFINGCRLYIQLKMASAEEEDKILLVLSYMSEGFTVDWRDNLLEQIAADDPTVPVTVEQLYQDIKTDFGDTDEQSSKISELRMMTQGTHTCEEHMQKFKKVARGTGYQGQALVEEFKQSLNAGLRKRLMEADEVPNTIDDWYRRSVKLD